jgi:hypothetical protein
MEKVKINNQFDQVCRSLLTHRSIQAAICLLMNQMVIVRESATGRCGTKQKKNINKFIDKF